MMECGILAGCALVVGLVWKMLGVFKFSVVDRKEETISILSYQPRKARPHTWEVDMFYFMQYSSLTF